MSKEPSKEPYVHKMDSHPDFLASMKFVREVLVPRFQEEKKKQQEQTVTEPSVVRDVSSAGKKKGKRKSTKKKKKNVVANGFVKQYGVLVKDGVKVVVTNLTAFLREHGYPKKDTSVLHKVLKGHSYFYRGWTLVGGPVEGMNRSEIISHVLKQQESK